MKKRILASICAAVMAMSAVSAFTAVAEDDGTPHVKGIQMIGGSDHPDNSDRIPDFRDVFDEYVIDQETIDNIQSETASYVIDQEIISYVDKSCTIKNARTDITIDAGDNDLIVVLDDLELYTTITVKADKGSVTFYVKGDLICNSPGSGIVWDEITDGKIVHYSQGIPIKVYGVKDSTVTLEDGTMLCGNCMMPETELTVNGHGRITVEYINEMVEDFLEVKTFRPSMIGTFLFESVNTNGSEALYCNESNEQDVVMYGDANEDGFLDMSDAVMIMQSISNPAKFRLSDKGKVNADVAGGSDGVTNADALAIQKHLLQLK